MRDFNPSRAELLGGPSDHFLLAGAEAERGLIAQQGVADLREAFVGAAAFVGGRGAHQKSHAVRQSALHEVAEVFEFFNDGFGTPRNGVGEK